MIEFLDGIDSQLLLFLNSLHCSFFDGFMYIATGKWTWVPFYLGLTALLFHRHGWQRSLVWLTAIALAILLADQLCASVIRPYVGRMRPANELNPLSEMVHIVNGYRGGSYGFPSCHGSNSFALSIIVALIARRTHITILVLGWALLHVYSRIYLGVHYPGDILVGALIGGLCAMAAYFAGRFAISRMHLREHEYQPGHIGLPTGFTGDGAISTTNVRITCEAGPVATFFGTLIVLFAIAL